MSRHRYGAHLGGKPLVLSASHPCQAQPAQLCTTYRAVCGGSFSGHGSVRFAKLSGMRYAPNVPRYLSTYREPEAPDATDGHSCILPIPSSSSPSGLIENYLTLRMLLPPTRNQQHDPNQRCASPVGQSLGGTRSAFKSTEVSFPLRQFHFAWSRLT